MFMNSIIVIILYSKIVLAPLPAPYQWTQIGIPRLFLSLDQSRLNAHPSSNLKNLLLKIKKKIYTLI